MIRIGNRTIVFSSGIILPDEEIAEIAFPIEGWNFRIFLSFHPNSGTEQQMLSTVENDALRFRFNRWDNALGTSFKEPINVARSPSGKNIALYVMQHHVGDMNHIALQFTVENANG